MVEWERWRGQQELHLAGKIPPDLGGKDFFDMSNVELPQFCLKIRFHVSLFTSIEAPFPTRHNTDATCISGLNGPSTLSRRGELSLSNRWKRASESFMR